ncbi:MAG: CpaF family protein [Nitrospira sp.]|nr:CpaF family protein [Nitrospira sp.]MCP9462600.1 CpaF family protein [Nitrospira sp.]MCP9475921.1 CpaF family protein [Nitrospira sp.]
MMSSAPSPEVGEAASSGQDLSTLQDQVYRALLARLDVTHLAQLDRESLEMELAISTMAILESQGTALRTDEIKKIVEAIRSEVLGYGPLDVLLNDPSVSDILVNGASRVYVERAGRLQETTVRFRDDTHLRDVIDKIVAQVGRRIDESSPMVDARLPDGSRVNAVLPPLALDGPLLSIRKFVKDRLSLSELIGRGSLVPAMGDFLAAVVRARRNVVISGGTGSGKTTLLNMLSENIPPTERIVTIEDAAELQLRQPHVVRLETRPPNLEGQGEVTQRDLVRNCLRMRPDRIILGEIRSAEALDMLQAMNTGHDGSLVTVHANSPADAMSRIEMMVAMANVSLPPAVVKQTMASALHIIVQASRLSDGTRKVVGIHEVVGMRDDFIALQELFRFEQRAVDEEGRVLGVFVSTGNRPRCLPLLRAQGLRVSDDWFQPREHSLQT